MAGLGGLAGADGIVAVHGGGVGKRPLAGQQRRPRLVLNDLSPERDCSRIGERAATIPGESRSLAT